MKKILFLILVLTALLFPLFSAEEAVSAEDIRTATDLELSDETMALLMERLKSEGIVPQEEQRSWWQREVDDIGVSYDFYLRAPVTYNTSTIGIGGGFNIGLKTRSFKFEAYVLGDYYLTPHGSNGGVQSLDFMIESGIMFGWKILDVWITKTYITLDVGYFMQFASLPGTPNVIFLAENGVMLRPKVMTEFTFNKYYDMAIGIFYQIPVYPNYAGYRGFGVMVSLC